MVASYPVGSDDTLDVYYESLTGEEFKHAVVFLDEADRIIGAFRYRPAAQGVQIQGAWPGVKEDQAQLRLYDGDIVVHQNTVTNTDSEPFSLGGKGGWVNLGDTETGGRSIHRKPGEIRIDQKETLDGVSEPPGWCAPNNPGGLSSAPAVIMCTDYALAFPGAFVPTIKEVQVWAIATDWFQETPPPSDSKR